jgi:DNA-binding beta-propeller fold protein YncE
VIYFNSSIAFVATWKTVRVIDTSALIPQLKYSIPLPSDIIVGNNSQNGSGYEFHELGLTRDKENLYVATGFGAVIIDVPRAILGRNDSVVGALSKDGYAGDNAVSLSITPDDRYVFVSQEMGNDLTDRLGTLEVWEVTRQENRSVTGEYKGYVKLGYATIGQLFSRDYTKLFVTSQLGAGAKSSNETEGSISVLDVETLKIDPSAAFLYSVRAGCHPVRITASPDGSILWVTAREANQLIAIDARKVLNNITTADVRLASIQTGTSPVAVAAVGNYVFTADSNRFSYSNTTTGITVVDAQTAINGSVDTFPQVLTDQFPREFAVSPDGNTLLVSEYDASTIRAIDISPLAMGTVVV